LNFEPCDLNRKYFNLLFDKSISAGILSFELTGKNYSCQFYKRFLLNQQARLETFQLSKNFSAKNHACPIRSNAPITYVWK
jgi:hypothetical protein